MQLLNLPEEPFLGGRRKTRRLSPAGGQGSADWKKGSEWIILNHSDPIIIPTPLS